MAATECVASGSALSERMTSPSKSQEAIEVQGTLPLQPDSSPDCFAMFRTNWDTVVDSFDAMALKDDLLRGIYAYGLERPSDLQRRAIVPCSQHRDVIVQSGAASGKTVTGILAILQQIDPKLNECQALLLVPTRELAQGIQKLIVSLGDYLHVSCFACVGGLTPADDDAKRLTKGTHVVVGTPSRVYDMIQREALNARSIKIFVLDDADEILTRRGKEDEIDDVFRLLPPMTQVVLLSSTMPPEVLKAAKRFTRDPVRIRFQKPDLSLEGIRQFYIFVDKEDWKMETFCDLYEAVNVTQALVFCNSRRKVLWLSDQLAKKNLTASALHGEMDQQERDLVIRAFRCGTSRLLITTDQFARSIDVAAISLVINYDLCHNRDSYVNRVGRSGEFGRKGVVINLITEEDKPIVRDIEHFYVTVIDEMPQDIANYL